MRWWVRTLLITATAILAVVGAIIIYLFPFHGLENLVGKELTSAISARYPVKLTIGEIRGNFIDGLVMEDIRVDYLDSAGTYPILTARRIVASYSIWNIWRADYSFSYVGLDSVRMKLHRLADGRINFPQPKTTTARSPLEDTVGAPPKPLRIFVSELELTNGELQVTDTADTLSFANLFVAMALQVEDQLISVDVQHASGKGNREPYSLDAFSGKLSYADGQLVMQDVTLARNDLRANMDGVMHLRDKFGGFDFDINNLDMADVSAVLKVNLKGKLDLNGKIGFAKDSLRGEVSIAGNFFLGEFDNLFLDFHVHNKNLYLDTLFGLIYHDCSIDGKGQIDFSIKPETYHADVVVTNFNLYNLLKKGFETSINGAINLDGRGFKGQDMLLNISANVYESAFDEYPLQMAGGDLIVTTRTLGFGEGFSVIYHENQFNVTGVIEYGGDLDLAVDAQLANLDRYRGKLFMKELGGRATATATLYGPTSNPGIRGQLHSDSLWLYGVYSRESSGTFNIDKFARDPAGTVDAVFLGGSIYGRRYDTAIVSMWLAEEQATIDSVRVKYPDGWAAASGNLEYAGETKHLVLHRADIEAFGQAITNRDSVVADISDDAISIRHARFGNLNSEGTITGDFYFNEQFNVNITADRVPVKTWGNLVREDFPFDGLASLTARIAGSAANPQFSLSGDIDSLVYNEILLGDLHATGRYTDLTVLIDTLRLTSAAGLYDGEGHFGADLSFKSDEFMKLIEAPLDMRIHARDSSFDLATALLPSVEDLQGQLTADVRIYGTPSDPHIEGTPQLVNARLKYFDLVDTIYADTAVATFNDNIISLNDVQIYVKDETRDNVKRYATLDGDITVATLDTLVYDLDISMPREFPFNYELEDIRGRVEGDLHVDGPTPPKVTGDLTILAMTYRAEFADEEVGSPVMSLLVGDRTWDLDLNIDIPSNYWIKNSDIDAEFSGTMNLIRENGAYRYIGEMELLRGKGFLFDKTFRIEPDSRVLFDDINRLNPTLDIKACTRIAGAARVSEEDDNSPVDLCIHVAGTLETPELNTYATSDDESAIPREDILPLLIANTASSDTLGATGGNFSNVELRLAGLVSSQVSQLGTRQLNRLGVETFEFDPTYREGQFDPLRSRVTLGAYAPGGIYVYGRSALTGRLGEEIGFEYRFNRSLRVEGRRDEDELYHLNLQLHWEF